MCRNAKMVSSRNIYLFHPTEFAPSYQRKYQDTSFQLEVLKILSFWRNIWKKMFITNKIV